MVTLEVLGRVHPQGFTVNIAAPEVTYTADDGTLTGRMEIRVIDSAISVKWTLNRYAPDQLFHVWRHSQRVVTGMVDLIALRLGVAAVVVLDRYRDNQGREELITLGEPAVKGLITSLANEADIEKVFALLADEQELLLVVEDLITGLGSQDHKTINCARCVEAVRQLIAGYDLEPKQQWPIIHENLNLDANYLKLITDHSKDHRHGKQTPVDPTIVVEIMRRTWIVIDRFIHFRLGRNGRLDLREFPLLTGP